MRIVSIEDNYGSQNTRDREARLNCVMGSYLMCTMDKCTHTRSAVRWKLVLTLWIREAAIQVRLMSDLSAELTNTAYCLVVAKIRDRVPVSKQETQKIW